jgi:hypothetical protein
MEILNRIGNGFLKLIKKKEKFDEKLLDLFRRKIIKILNIFNILLILSLNKRNIVLLSPKFDEDFSDSKRFD